MRQEKLDGVTNVTLTSCVASDAPSTRKPQTSKHIHVCSGSTNDPRSTEHRTDYMPLPTVSGATSPDLKQDELQLKQLCLQKMRPKTKNSRKGSRRLQDSQRLMWPSSKFQTVHQTLLPLLANLQKQGVEAIESCIPV